MNPPEKLTPGDERIIERAMRQTARRRQWVDVFFMFLVCLVMAFVSIHVREKNPEVVPSLLTSLSLCLVYIIYGHHREMKEMQSCIRKLEMRVRYLKEKWPQN